jgi:hypothetical protein
MPCGIFLLERHFACCSVRVRLTTSAEKNVWISERRKVLLPSQGGATCRPPVGGKKIISNFWPANLNESYRSGHLSLWADSIVLALKDQGIRMRIKLNWQSIWTQLQAPEFHKERNLFTSSAPCNVLSYAFRICIYVYIYIYTYVLYSRWGEFLNLPNPSGLTRPWGLLSL